MYTCRLLRASNIMPFRGLFFLIVLWAFFWWSTAQTDSRFTKYALSSTSAFAGLTNSTTQTDVTNLTVTFRATGGKIVRIKGIDVSATGTGFTVSQGNEAAPNYATVTVVKNGADWAQYRFGASTNADYDDVPDQTRGYFPCSSIDETDFPTAGSHTYKITVANGTATSSSISVDSCKLLVYELP